MIFFVAILRNLMENQHEKKSGNRIFAILSVLFALLSAFLGYQLWNQKQTTTVIIQQKEQLNTDFESTRTELSEVQKAFEGLQTNNKQLQSELDAKKEEIEDLMEKVNKYKGDAAMLVKLRKEIQNLKNSIAMYVHHVDSLNTVNKALTEENTQVKTDLASEKDKSEKLSSEKKQLIELGSKHKVYDFFADAIRIKGGSKEIATTKARRVDKIRANFILGENKIAKTGELNLYMKVTAPDGQVLVTSKDDNNMFMSQGSRQYYSAKKTLSFNGSSQDVCLYFVKKENEKLKDGDYKVEVFVEGEPAGISSFKLK